MAGVVGIRFGKAGKIEYYDPGSEELGQGNYVVVQKDDGQEIGYVVIAPGQVVMSKMKGSLPGIIRAAMPEDLRRRDELHAEADRALTRCRELVQELKLGMKLTEAHYPLDGDKLFITYTSEDRVDFRDLLSRLGRDVRARIELRQVGPRDDAKVKGGLGRCGRELCCSTWLVEFQPVTMKMAKEQDLPLSPAGLAGQCGRLRCCLRYEYEQYRELKRGLPKIGSRVQTAQGAAVVVVGHPIKQTITVRLESGAWAEVPMAELQQSQN